MNPKDPNYMALTPSNMLALNTRMPSFQLIDTVTGEQFRSSGLRREKGTVVMFICNHCPYVIHIQDEMVRIAKKYQEEGFEFVAISSNDVENYPADSPQEMRKRAVELDFQFPYLYDEDQVVAKEFEAACTPDFYLFDRDDHCVYRGRMDGSTPGNGVPVTGSDLRGALDLLLQGKKVPEGDQLASMGCNIKWK